MEIKVYQDKDKESIGVNSWTFSVDGQASGYWCPNQHAVNRVIGRLNSGRCREAFGGTGQVSNVQVSTSATTSKGRGCIHTVKPAEHSKEVTLGSGKTKSRDNKESYSYSLDGVRSDKEFGSEQEAKVALAFHAFMTRGKLGRLQEAKEHFESTRGKKCEVNYDGKTVSLLDEDGVDYLVGLYPGESPRFKQKEQK